MKISWAELLNDIIEASIEGKKQFKCDLCITDCDLNEHIAIEHEGKKSLKCDLCGETFATDGDLKEHHITAHKGKMSFKCNLCDGCFVSETYLNEQMKQCIETTKLFLVTLTTLFSSGFL